MDCYYMPCFLSVSRHLLLALSREPTASRPSGRTSLPALGAPTPLVPFNKCGCFPSHPWIGSRAGQGSWGRLRDRRSPAPGGPVLRTPGSCTACPRGGSVRSFPRRVPRLLSKLREFAWAPSPTPFPGSELANRTTLSRSAGCLTLFGSRDKSSLGATRAAQTPSWAPGLVLPALRQGPPPHPRTHQSYPRGSASPPCRSQPAGNCGSRARRAEGDGSGGRGGEAEGPKGSGVAFSSSPAAPSSPPC